MSDTFQNRLNKAIALRGISAAELARMTNLSKAQISQYTNGIYIAKQVALYKLAVALDVSEPWLMGHDVPIERVTTYTAETLNIKQKQLLIAYDALNDLGKEEAQKQIENLAYIPKYQKASTMPESHSNESEVQEEEDHLMPIAAHSTEPDGDVSEAVAIAKAFLKNRKKNPQ